MQIILRAARLLCLAAILCAVVSCKPAEEHGATEAAAGSAEHTSSSGSLDHEQTDSVPAAWSEFVDRYIEDFFATHPGFAVVQGRHEFDGQIQDWSAEGIAGEIARLKRVREDALAFDDKELGDQGRYQREYLVSSIDRALFWLDDAEWPFVNPAFYFDWMSDSIDPSPYVTLDYAPLEERMRSYITYAGNVVRAAGQVRANLRMPMARTRLQYGIDSFGGLADYFRNDIPGVFAAVENEELQSEFAEANGLAATAMQELADWLHSNLDTATEDFALGPDLFQKMIYDTERVDIPLDELQAMGLADMKRNQMALGEACAEFAPGQSVRNCFAIMANRKPVGGPVESARVQVEETRAFLIEQDLVTIPGNERALVAESPPYKRSNAAYINIPGPYEKNQPSVYYISPPNPEWSEEVQQAYILGESSLLFISVHEVWPGHFLNFLHAKRSEFQFGRIFVTYAFAEGWAHYTEEMMIEAGLRAADAETRIGQLSNALMRNARFLSAIGLHTRGMTVEESEKLFIEEAYQDEGTARQQAARGTYDPAYLNYTLGKLMIMDLRRDWTQQREGRESWREFHDTFLSFGGPPIPLVRAQMMKNR